MKKPVVLPFPNSSNDKKNAFARRKLRRMVGQPPAVSVRNLRRTEKTKITRIEGTENESGTVNVTGIVNEVVTTATRRRKKTGIAIATVSGRETEIMKVEEGSTTDEMISTTVIGPQRTTGTENMDIDRRSTTRTTTGTSGRGIPSIGMRTVEKRVGARGNDPRRRNAMREVRR